MENLNDFVEDDEKIGFDDLDSCFPSIDETDETSSDDDSTDDSIDEEEIVQTKPKGKRGRPPKKSAEETSTKNKDEEISKTTKTKKTTSKIKKVNIDDLPLEIIDYIFQNYSKKSLSSIAKHLEIDENDVKKSIKRLDELFTLAISTGDLDQEKYDSIIEPLLTPYREDNFNTFVTSEINRLKK